MVPLNTSVGVVLAIGSGVLIGSSFVFKKKGLLSSQKGHVAGEGVAYLKSVRSQEVLHYIFSAQDTRYCSLCGGLG